MVSWLLYKPSTDENQEKPLIINFKPITILNMKKVVLTTLCLLLALTFTTKSFAQVEDENAFSFSVGLNQDAFFGFYPTVTGSYLLSEKVDFTFYGILWAGGTGAAWGNWTEFGVGANFRAGNLDINPQLGFTMGNLLSSHAVAPGIIGDGIVPNLTLGYEDKLFEGEFYGGLYTALRNKAPQGGETANYVHYWANAGIKLASFASIGAHFEELFFSGGKGNEIADLTRQDGYRWIGPYVQFSDPKGKGAVRFSFGGDLTGDDSFSNSDFYKLSVTMNF